MLFEGKQIYFFPVSVNEIKLLNFLFLGDVEKKFKAQLL